MPSRSKKRSLLVHPLPELGESLPGYALRLTTENGFASIRHMLKATVPQPPARGRGSILPLLRNPRHAEAIADAARVPPEVRPRLRFPMRLKTWGGASAVDAGSTFYLEPKVRFECPQCLEEGLPHARTWLLRDNRCCAYHKILLLGHCPECGTAISWTAPDRHHCDHCGHDHRDSPRTPAGEQTTLLAHYFASRFHPGSKINAVEQLSDRLEAARQRVSTIATHLWAQGFPDATTVREAALIQETALALTAWKSGKATGKRVRDRTRSQGRAYIEACTEAYPNVPREVFSARLAVPVDPTSREGAYPTPRPTTIKLHTGASTDPYIDRYIEMSVVHQALKILPNQARELHEASLLPKPAESPGHPTLARTKQRYALEELDTFFSRLGGSSLPTRATSKTITLGRATSTFPQLSIAKLIKLVMWQRVEPMAWEPSKGLAAIEFEYADIRDIAEQRFASRTAPHVARKLGISSRGLKALVQAGIVDLHWRDLTNRIATNPTQNAPTAVTSLPQLGRWLENDPIIIRQQLAGEGVIPQPLHGDIPGFTYLWTDISNSATFGAAPTRKFQGNFLRQQVGTRVTSPQVLSALEASSYLDIAEQDVHDYIARGWLNDTGIPDSPTATTYRSNVLNLIDAHHLDVATISIAEAAEAMDESIDRFVTRWVTSGRAHTLPPDHNRILAIDFRRNVQPLKFTLTPREAAEITGSTLAEIRKTIRDGTVQPVSGPSTDGWPNHLIAVKTFLRYCFTYARTPVPRTKHTEAHQ